MQNVKCAFEKIKSLLLSVAVLKPPDFGTPFKLQVDASDIGIVLSCYKKGIMAVIIL